MRGFIITNVPIILLMRLNEIGGHITHMITAVRNACSILIRKPRGRERGLDVDGDNIKMHCAEIVLMGLIGCRWGRIVTAYGSY
jgi:hypothetical protein